MKYEIAPKETEIHTNWYDAKLYCFSLNTNNKTGWRLPTKDELNQIYQSENDYDQERYYWSSTEFNGGYSWIQYFSCGHQTSYYNKGSNYVRAVRTI